MKIIPVGDHPFQTSAFLGGEKIGQICRQIVVKIGVKNRKNWPNIDL